MNVFLSSRTASGFSTCDGLAHYTHQNVSPAITTSTLQLRQHNIQHATATTTATIATAKATSTITATTNDVNTTRLSHRSRASTNDASQRYSTASTARNDRSTTPLPHGPRCRSSNSSSISIIDDPTFPDSSGCLRGRSNGRRCRRLPDKQGNGQEDHGPCGRRS